MHICSGQIKYLVAVLEVSKTAKSKNVRCIDVANFLGVSRPSVTKMLKCLSSLNLIESDFSYGIVLTKEGQQVGKNFHTQYQYLYQFFSTMLKLPPEDSKEQAMQFVSTFPLETSSRFSTLIKNTINRRRRAQQGQTSEV